MSGQQPYFAGTSAPRADAAYQRHGTQPTGRYSPAAPVPGAHPQATNPVGTNPRGANPQAPGTRVAGGPGAQQPAPQGPGPGRSARARLALRVGALVAVAVVSGLVWWLIRYQPSTEGDAAAAEDPLTSGEFAYTEVAGPEISANCAGNSYGDVVGWFQQHPCERVHRSLYETREGDARALVSVVVVTMPEQDGAKQLKVTTDTDGTGNVNDLVRDGTATLPGAPNVAQGEYASRVVGTRLTIVETAYFPDSAGAPDTLQRIAHDALRLSAAAR